ncbi:MAG: hypothetical protein AAB250_12425 [Bdellovibrionota bacterium]
MLAVLIAWPALAHKGAHPDDPDKLASPLGGIIKETEKYHVEAVPTATAARLYFYDTKMKPTDVEKIQAKARISTPRATLNLVLEPKGMYFDAPYPREPLMRYKLIVVITDKKDEVLVYEIDPKTIKAPAKAKALEKK